VAVACQGARKFSQRVPATAWWPPDHGAKWASFFDSESPPIEFWETATPGRSPQCRLVAMLTLTLRPFSPHGHFFPRHQVPHHVFKKKCVRLIARPLTQLVPFSPHVIPPSARPSFFTTYIFSGGRGTSATYPEQLCPLWRGNEPKFSWMKICVPSLELNIMLCNISRSKTWSILFFFLIIYTGAFF
jgi:hypothetical protein